jgi:hypothetical protein
VKHTDHKHRSLKGDKMYHTAGWQHHELKFEHWQSDIKTDTQTNRRW